MEMSRTANAETEASCCCASKSRKRYGIRTGHDGTAEESEMLTAAKQRENDRGVWSNQVEAFLALLAYSTDVSCFTRFPHMVYVNGGLLVFLIPYLFFMIVFAMPMLYLELVLGQISGLSAATIWKMCPMFKGIGTSIFTLCMIGLSVYQIMISWILYYMTVSFRSLPWLTCDNHWNTEKCRMLYNDTSNPSYSSISTSPAEEYWTNVVIQSEGLVVGNLHGINYSVLGCLVVAWIFLFLCTILGPRSIGKVLYVTTALPFILLIVLAVRGFTLPGFYGGVQYFFIPDFSKLLNLRTWQNAFSEAFYSFGFCLGGYITIASYNRYDDRRTPIRNAIVIPILHTIARIFIGFVVFALSAFFAYEKNTNIEIGSGVYFIFELASFVSRLPAPNVWCVITLIIVFMNVFNTQMPMFELLVSSILDTFPGFMKTRRILARIVISAAMTLVCFLIGIVFTGYGALSWFYLVDQALGLAYLCIGFLQIIVVSYFYGLGRLYTDMKFMMKRMPSVVWKISWYATCPLLIALFFVLSVLGSGGQFFISPWWTTVVGWCIVMLTMLPVPVMVVVSLIRTNCNWCLRDPSWSRVGAVSNRPTSTAMERPMYPTAPASWLAPVTHNNPVYVTTEAAPSINPTIPATWQTGVYASANIESMAESTKK
ncbi:sodium- and chloride-dependent betaine transporter-like [Tubulanus polymorphus]|uniref:sodium- and chloride-dependent betaine transporter-like n=1 Tax=Tubulanus polymorphus TaxID=672921 RepID=UPI003DA1EFC4